MSQSTSQSKTMIKRIKSNLSDPLYLNRSEASTTNIEKQPLTSIVTQNQSQEDLIQNNHKNLSPDPELLKQLELHQSRASKLEKQYHFIQQKLDPLIQENNELKETIQAQNFYLEEQRSNLAELVQTISKNGDNRELIKQLGDFESLLKLLREDLMAKDGIINQQNEQIINYELQLKILVLEKEQNFDNIKKEFKKKKLKLKEQLQFFQTIIDGKNNDILDLEKKLQDENERILRTQILFQKEIQNLNQQILQFEQKIQESNKSYKELQKQTEDQMKLLRVDFTNQQTQLQDQYEFSLGELRFAYEVRMEKQLQDCENKVREAYQEKERLAKELDLTLKEKKQEIKQRENFEAIANNYLQQFNQIQSQLQSCKDQIVLLQSNMTQLSKGKQSIQREKESLLERIDELEIFIQQLTDQKSKIEGETQEMKKEQEYFRDSINQIKENYELRITKMQTLINSLMGSVNKRSSAFQSQKGASLGNIANTQNIKDMLLEQENWLQTQGLNISEKYQSSSSQNKFIEIEEVIENESQKIDGQNGLQNEKIKVSTSQNYDLSEFTLPQLTDKSSELLHFTQKSQVTQENFFNNQQKEFEDEEDQQNDEINQDAQQQNQKIDENGNVNSSEGQQSNQLNKFEDLGQKNNELKDQNNSKGQNTDMKQKLKQKKRQAQVIHIKNQLKQAKTILYQQKQKTNHLIHQLQMELKKGQDEKIKELVQLYESQIESLRKAHQDAVFRLKNETIKQRQLSEENEKQIVELKDINQNYEDQIKEEKQFTEILTEQCEKEVKQIILETNKRIQESNLLRQLYEKQIEGYEKQFKNLSILVDRFILSQANQENQNNNLLDQMKELQQQLEQEKLKYQEVQKTVKSIENQQNQVSDQALHQLKAQIYQAENMLQNQEIQFRHKVEDLKNILFEVQKENDLFKQIIQQNEEKVKKFNDLRIQYHQSLERVQRVEDQLNKASEIINYFTLELENYKKIYNIFSLPKQPQSIKKVTQNLPSVILENRMLHSKLNAIKEKHQAQIYKNGLTINSNSIFFMTNKTNKEEEMSDSNLPYLKNNQKVGSGVSSTIEKERKTVDKSDQSPQTDKSLYFHCKLLMDNLYDQPLKGPQHRCRVKSIQEIQKKKKTLNTVNQSFNLF